MATKEEVIARASARFAEEIAQEIYGENGPDENQDIDAIEDDAVLIVRAAFDACIAEALRLRSQQLPPQLPCPQCQQMCRVKKEERTIQGRVGPSTIQEPFCSCSACGRDFFPSAGTIAAG